MARKPKTDTDTDTVLQPEPTTDTDPNNQNPTTDNNERTPVMTAANPFLNQTPEDATPVEATATTTSMTAATPSSIAPVQTADFSHGSSLDVTLDSEVKLNVIDKLPEMNKDECSRIALIAFDDNNAPLIKMSQQYYVDMGNGTKLMFLAPENKELLAKIIARFGEPKVRFATIVLRYNTDKRGAVLNQDTSFHVWQFGTDKWPDLKNMHQKWNLFNHDIAIQCKDPQFQKLNMVPEPDCYWQKLPYAKDIMAQARSLYETALKKFIARKIPDNELEIKLGFKEAPPASPSVNPFSPQGQTAAQVNNTPANPFAAFVKK